MLMVAQAMRGDTSSKRGSKTARLRRMRGPPFGALLRPRLAAGQGKTNSICFRIADDVTPAESLYVSAVERGGPVRALVVLGACLLGAGGCRRSASTGARAVAVDLVEAFAATESAGPMTEIHAGDRRATSSFVEGWSPPARDEDGRDVA